MTVLGSWQGVDSQKVFDNQRRMAPVEGGHSGNLIFEWGEFEPDTLLKVLWCLRCVDTVMHDMLWYRSFEG